MKIIVDDKIPFIKGAFEGCATVEYHKGSDIDQQIVADADVLIVRTRTKCNQELLEGSTIKFIATATIGFDHIDTQYCEQNNIEWTNAPGCNSGSVMQYIASVLVQLSELEGFNLDDKTLGVVGVGNVGSKVAKLAASMGMRVLLNDPPRERKEQSKVFVDMATIQREADIITFHTPLNQEGTDKTYHLFDEEFANNTKPELIIINTSRGEVVCNKALKNALKNKMIKGAVLDVWENEPAIDTELLNLVDIASPHIAGYSVDGKAKGTTMSVQAVSKKFGLGLDNWEAEGLPVPKETSPMFDSSSNLFSSIRSLILYTYDVLEDDKRLRASVAEFENQRGSYPPRREFYAYTPTITPADKGIAEILSNLSFGV